MPKLIRRNHKVIPSAFTTLNLFSGFIALVLIFADNFVSAAWFIVLAAIFDACDGKIARINGVTSQFGVEADSLADVVSFGVVPATLIYRFHLANFGFWGLILSFLFLLCVMYRLARFNVETIPKRHSNSYSGLPAPMAAITVASIIFLIGAANVTLTTIVTVPLLLLLCTLMISRIKYDSFPVFSFKHSRSNSIKLFFLFGCLVLLSFFWRYAFLFLMLFYIFFGLGRSLITLGMKGSIGIETR